MSWSRFIILLYIAAALQTSLIPLLFPDWARPLALVILASFTLLTRRIDRAIASAFIIGLIADLTSITPLGTATFAFGIYAIIIISTRPILFIESPLTHAITTAIGILTIYTSQTILCLVNSGILPVPFTILEIIGQIIISGIISAAIAYYIPIRTGSRYRFWA